MQAIQPGDTEVTYEPVKIESSPFIKAYCIDWRKGGSAFDYVPPPSLIKSVKKRLPYFCHRKVSRLLFYPRIAS